MGQPHPKLARADPPTLAANSSTGHQLDSDSSRGPQTPATAPVDTRRNAMDFNATALPSPVYYLARSFSKHSKSRRKHGALGSVTLTSPADDYKQGMLRKLGSVVSPVDDYAPRSYASQVVDAATTAPPCTSALAGTTDVRGRCSPSIIAPVTPIKGNRITPSNSRRVQRPPSSGGRSSSIKSSKRAEREWRARLAALSATSAVALTSGDHTASTGPVPPRRHVARPRAPATHACKSTTQMSQNSIDFRRELTKATSFETLGAKAWLTPDRGRGSRPVSAATSKTLSPITAQSDRFNLLPTTPHHLTLLPLTPNATPPPSPVHNRESIAPFTPLDILLSSRPSSTTSPVSAQFDTSLSTPPQLRPLSEFSGLSVTFQSTPRSTAAELLLLHDDDGRPILASRKRDKMVGSRRSIPRLREAANDPVEQHPPEIHEKHGRRHLPTPLSALHTPTKSGFSLDFISSSQSISSVRSLNAGTLPESPTTKFILNAPSIERYAWGMEADLLGNGNSQRSSMETPPTSQKSQRRHPFAASTATTLEDPCVGYDTSPSPKSATPQQLPSPVGSSPPSTIAYGPHAFVEYTLPSSPSPMPRQRSRRGGVDVDGVVVPRVRMKPLNDVVSGRRDINVVTEVSTQEAWRKAGLLTPGSAEGQRPPKSGLPRPDLERWLQSACV